MVMFASVFSGTYFLFGTYIFFISASDLLLWLISSVSIVLSSSKVGVININFFNPRTASSVRNSCCCCYCGKVKSTPCYGLGLEFYNDLIFQESVKLCIFQ